MTEVEFRDGKHPVPDHVAQILAPYETYRLSLSEALEFMNRVLLNNHLAPVKDKLIREHLTRYGVE